MKKYVNYLIYQRHLKFCFLVENYVEYKYSSFYFSKLHGKERLQVGIPVLWLLPSAPLLWLLSTKECAAKAPPVLHILSVRKWFVVSAWWGD